MLECHECEYSCKGKSDMKEQERQTCKTAQVKGFWWNLKSVN